ncbi:MAG: hypothetical protein ACREL7_17135 [Longimicrobiales bacterium]
MSVKSVRFETEYHVADGDVRITIRIGEGQFGTSVMTLEDRVFGPGDVNDVLLGPGSQLGGLVLQVKSIVTDINDMTDRTSIAYELEGGHVPATHVLVASVDEEGGSVIYRSRIRFL